MAQVQTKIDFTLKSAVFSPCRTYRYTLERKWNDGDKTLNFIMLNPSTADENLEDPTIRRCCFFAKDNSFDGVIITNLFAFRATLPSDMKKYPWPTGPENDRYVLESASRASTVIAAWGSHGSHLNRSDAVCKLLSDIDLYCISLTKDGFPGHPLYLPKNAAPFLFRKLKS